METRICEIEELLNAPTPLYPKLTGMCSCCVLMLWLLDVGLEDWGYSVENGNLLTVCGVCLVIVVVVVLLLWLSPLRHVTDL